MSSTLFNMLYALGLLLGSLVRGRCGSEPNSTYNNPIFPGFHPDPSCVFLPGWDNTVLCASSSFNAFPGIPLHASKDLQNWKLIGHVLNRKEQLPRLQETNRSTSGIWAPTIRYHHGTFYLVTTLVDDDRPQTDASRWDNIIFQAKDPFDPLSWSNPIGFDLEGYDTSPFWDEDGKTYIVAAHAWQVFPGIQLSEVNLDTGEIGGWETIWNGTGGMAPEGPHIYRKDGYYYMLVAEGGTGEDHMVSMARSKSIRGPWEPHPANPVLTNANTTNYFQTVGHADLFHDASGNWWCVALSTRSGPEYLHYPMGRETVMTPVTWKEGEWPVFSPVNGVMSGWPMPPTNLDVVGPGPTISNGTVQPEDIDFAPGSSLPAHLTHWRAPVPESYAISPPGLHAPSLRLAPSRLNLTALDGNHAGAAGQTLVARRQQDTLFTYGVDLAFAPAAPADAPGHEAGVTVFLTQNHHLDLGLVLLPLPAAAAADGPLTEPRLHLRFRAISYVPVPDPVLVPVPEAWAGAGPLRLEIKACNASHYVFSAGPARAPSRMRAVAVASNEAVSWGFTGALLGVYCTSNGGNGTTPAYVSNWRYTPQGQFRS